MDAHSHILNKPKWTSLLGSQVYFEESKPGHKETQYLSCEVLTSPKKSTRDLLDVFNELEEEQKECSKCEETSVMVKRN